LVDVSALDLVLTTLKDVLTGIERDISALEDKLEGADDDLERVGIDSMIEDGAVFYHDMLGIAFMACQVEIARAVAEIQQMHDMARRKGIELPTVRVDPETKRVSRKEIMRFGFPDEPPAPSPAEVINAAANYQKHSDEWPRKWDVGPPPNKERAKTIEILKAIGIKSDDFAVDACARHLGINGADDLMRLLDHISSWRSKLAQAYKRDLVAKGVHPPDGAP
jgi:hypothetical protein